jgi:Domain of unknown function (DUF4832)/Domain of unknown function (DUF4874)
MTIRQLMVATIAVAATASFGLSAVAQEPPAHSQGLVKVEFEPTDADIINPERGFSQFGTHPLNLNTLNNGRNQGRSVFGMMVNLNNFRSTPISDTFLNALQTSFNNVRTAGVKVKLRFRYDSTAAGQDAPLELVLHHIEQITPLLERNSDVIMHLESGFIGAWGEWHSSSNNLVNHWEDNFGNEVNDSTRAIVDALLEALPEDRMISVRTPRYKHQLVGDTKNLTNREAFSGTPRSRIGFYNDCFLSNETDWGTFADRDADLAWLGTESLYVPMAGETCSADEDAAPYIACPNAIREMDGTHWNALNINWNPAVYAHWQATGCMDDVRERLGYRFVLESAKAPRSVPEGGSLRLHLEVTNAGFATPFNERPVEAVLRDVATRETHVLPLNADPRRWWSGETHNYPFRVQLPAEVGAGTYDVLVNLPDAAETLRDDPRYSIRLANESTWEPATGFNDLGLRVIVTG